ncbi:hypothetical protein D0865_12183 [Hortaea werneckii]|uniref:Heterokaryon incompatibility domain-containing protein n=1 Tax=Hortaea werneckii TaxID=91943 RepID=A0A3M7BPR7_HORWE|nr:hypothetical protein D0865_12183 [Hortaea werneckii]
MLLLNARTYALKFFHTAKTAPPYAILSHTWEDDEVLFKDMDDLEKAKAKSGWQKIEYVCRQALEDGLEWAWVDTCCIDKSSSAELSEAINSMFNWYKCSTVCYVYLCDLTITATLRDDAPMVSAWLEKARNMTHIKVPHTNPELDISKTLWQEHAAYFEMVTCETRSGIRKRIDAEGSGRHRDGLEISLIDTLGAFSKVKWWSRGWTLQELLAPRNVVFMDQKWQQIARLPELVVTVSTISSVDVKVLLHTASLQSRCIAERLSWASRRSTTREEDSAYSLLGIFDANMPLLYGEGNRAFKRLQEVISLRLNDLSIYAWLKKIPLDDHLMFAASPSYFATFNAVRKRSSGPTIGMTTSSMGITLTSPVIWSNAAYWIDLGCYNKSTPNLQMVLMVEPRERISENLPHDWLRLEEPIVHPRILRATELDQVSVQNAGPRSLTIVPCLKELRSYIVEDPFATLLTVHLPKEQYLPLENAYPRGFWNLHITQFYCAQRDLAFPLTAGLEFKAPDGHPICLAIRLYRRKYRDSFIVGTHTVSSATISDRFFVYQCFAELVPELAIDQACTRLLPLYTHNSSRVGVATSQHFNHSQNVGRLSLGGRHLTVQVVEGETHVINNGIIMFEIFIHAATPTTEEDGEPDRRRTRLKRKPQKRESVQSRSYRGTIIN